MKLDHLEKNVSHLIMMVDLHQQRRDVHKTLDVPRTPARAKRVVHCRTVTRIEQE